MQADTLIKYLWLKQTHLYFYLWTLSFLLNISLVLKESNTSAFWEYFRFMEAVDLIEEKNKQKKYNLQEWSLGGKRKEEKHNNSNISTWNPETAIKVPIFWIKLCHITDCTHKAHKIL